MHVCAAAGTAMTGEVTAAQDGHGDTVAGDFSGSEHIAVGILYILFGMFFKLGTRTEVAWFFSTGTFGPFFCFVVVVCFCF